MLKSEKLLVDYKEELMKTYGYDEHLAEDIVIAGESVVDYLGSEYEDLVFSSLKGCKVLLAKKGETVASVLKANDLIGGVASSLKDDDLKRSSGVSAYREKISHDQGGFSLDGVERAIVLPNTFDANSTYYLGVLVREIHRLTRSALNSHTIEGDTLTVKKGLQTSTYTLEEKNGKVVRSLQSESGMGIEEGLISYATLSTMRNSYDPSYELETSEYHPVVSGYLADNLGLKDSLIAAEITKDDAAIREIFDSTFEGGYDSFIRTLDELLSLEKSRKDAVLDSERLKEATSSLERYYELVVSPMIAKASVKLKGTGELENGHRKSA